MEQKYLKLKEKREGKKKEIEFNSSITKISLHRHHGRTFLAKFVPL